MLIPRVSFFNRGVLLASLLCGLSVTGLLARSFTVAAYNVENLFDVDGRAAYDDYQPQKYKPAHLRTKIDNISKVLARLDEAGHGPDIILFNEVEVDQSPSAAVVDTAALIAPEATHTAEQLLSGELSAAVKDWPAEAWLLKSAQDHGLTGYTVVVGSDSAEQRYEDGNRRAIKCVIFTRFPVKAVRNHPIPNARNILEVLLEVDGKPLYVFSNHWKSGAGDAGTERFRADDARVLRARLDEILAADPHVDVIIGGDFNSQYNQRQRYPQMKETGMNDVLGSQGDELAIRNSKPDLYNLWYELPKEKRGSDVFRGEWGTLIQLLITRGLYDFRGVQYVDGSFRVGRIPGLNAAADGTPIRWSFEGNGAGFSDHFPIIARFVTVEDNDATRWLELKNPSDGATPSESPKVALSATDLAGQAIDSAKLPAGVNLRDGTYSGKLLLVEARPLSGQRPSVEFRGETYEIYSPESQVRDLLRKKWPNASKVRFYGELGQYKGRWQFVVKQADWLLSAE